jgi:hypothetical protein
LSGDQRTVIAAHIGPHLAAQPDAFTYLYDALHESRGETALVQDIALKFGRCQSLASSRPICECRLSG